MPESPQFFNLTSDKDTADFEKPPIFTLAELIAQYHELSRLSQTAQDRLAKHLIDQHPFYTSSTCHTCPALVSAFENAQTLLDDIRAQTAKFNVEISLEKEDLTTESELLKEVS